VIVALLSDFGTRDHYVGSMKGVVLSVCPAATLVDLTHDIPPQDILSGALTLRDAYRAFPAGTVFLTVVDPGVGSARRAIAADAGGYRFTGPDNGVLWLALEDAGTPRIVELRERKFARSQVSRTFEGRDRFAPAAGWLARGMDVAAFGPVVSDPTRLVVPQPLVGHDTIDGEVLSVDRFGNLITNISASILQGFPTTRVGVSIGGRTIDGIVGTYADADAHTPCALIGSNGYLEIAVNGGSAASVLHVGRGAKVALTPGA
jgi:S-adenosylmethionine hydrolase